VLMTSALRSLLKSVSSTVDPERVVRRGTGSP
jgi:hypothetical protein